MRFIGALLILAAGCATESPEQSQLNSALETWSVHGPSAYAFTWQQSCECSAETTRAIRISVVDNAITSAFYLETEQPVGTDVRARLLTIDGIFGKIQSAIDEGAHAVTVQYDNNAGHPVSVAVDYSAQIADEELAITVRDFVSNVQRPGSEQPR
jgi:hypothetical protein